MKKHGMVWQGVLPFSVEYGMERGFALLKHFKSINPGNTAFSYYFGLHVEALNTEVGEVKNRGGGSVPHRAPSL